SLGGSQVAIPTYEQPGYLTDLGSQSIIKTNSGDEPRAHLGLDTTDIPHFSTSRSATATSDRSTTVTPPQRPYTALLLSAPGLTWIKLLRDTQKNEPEVWSRIPTSTYNKESETAVDAPFRDNEDSLDESNVSLDVVIEHVASGSQLAPAGFVINTDGQTDEQDEGAVPIQSEDEILDGYNSEPAQELRQGKRCQIATKRYKDFWNY
ncbi:hypothetical protein BV22DRAFT_1051853, partial [Leucogyrophana mollusca]